MPKKTTDLKQSKILFVPVKKTPPPILISSPNRKSVTDLADNFELLANCRITRSSSNLSVPPERTTLLVSQKRSASLDTKMAPRAHEEQVGEKLKGPGGVDPKADSKGPNQDSSEAEQPSNAEIMEMLRGMKQDFTKEIKSELSDFRTETISSMATLQANVQSLGENQKSIESSIDAIKSDQDSLAKEVKDLRAELSETKQGLAEHREMTGTDINEIAKNMKAATERVTLDADLQNAINRTAKDIVIQDYKPDKSLSHLDAGRKFLTEIMGKNDKEINSLE